MQPDINYLIEWPKVYDLIRERWEKHKDERAVSWSLQWLRWRYGEKTGGDIIRIIERDNLVDFITYICGVPSPIASDTVPPEMTSKQFKNWLKSFDAYAHDKHLPWVYRHEVMDEICFY